MSTTDSLYEIQGSTLTIYKPCIAIFGAENSDLTHFTRSTKNPTNIVERPDASNGKFLAAGSDSTDSINTSYFTFTLSLQINCEITMSASYSQPPGWNQNEIDMRDSYHFLIDENKSVCLSENFMLSPRDDITKWSTITYDTFTLPKGEHSFRVSVQKQTGLGNPNIDYLSFDIKEISEAMVNSEVKKPENDFHSILQFAYLNDKPENIHLYARGVKELSFPDGILLDLSNEKNFECDCESFSVEYDDNPNFLNPSSVVCSSKSKKCAVYNLLLGQNLFWRVKNSESVHNLTITKRPPRNLFIEGVTNVRDIGGYKSSLVESGTINQGLYLRGSNINKITLNGKKELLRLGVKTEIDMRDKYMCKGPYIDGIEYHAVPVPSCTEDFRFEEFENEYKEIFSLIANADKNPVYLHCAVGADRTGIVTFILLIVCGASYEDTARDYLFTNFSTCGGRYLDSEFSKWWMKLDNFDGKTKADKAKSWLISKGITDSMVEHIREIFVDNYRAKQ